MQRPNHNAVKVARVYLMRKVNELATYIERQPELMEKLAREQELTDEIRKLQSEIQQEVCNEFSNRF